MKWRHFLVSKWIRMLRWQVFHMHPVCTNLYKVSTCMYSHQKCHGVSLCSMHFFLCSLYATYMYISNTETLLDISRFYWLATSILYTQNMQPYSEEWAISIQKTFSLLVTCACINSVSVLYMLPLAFSMNRSKFNHAMNAIRTGPCVLVSGKKVAWLAPIMSA